MVTSVKKTAAAGKKKIDTEIKKTAIKKVVKEKPESLKKNAVPAVKKVAAKTPAVKKTVVKKQAEAEVLTAEKKPAVAKKSASAKKKVKITPEERWHMIATAAYFLAERRGFAAGYEMLDWKTAEAEIDEKFNT